MNYENKFVQSFTTAQINKLEDSYSSEAQTIKGKSKSKNLASRDKIKLYQREYKPKIDLASTHLAEQRVAHDLLLRKAVLEIFSVNDFEGLNIKNLPEVIDEVTQNLDNLPEDKRLKVEKKLKLFISDLIEYLETTKDAQLMTRYKYRESENIVSTENDTKVLERCLQLALTPGVSSDDNDTQTYLQQLGESYFVFLANRSKFLSNSVNSDYPYLSLIYDIYSSTLMLKSTTILENISDLTNKVFLNAESNLNIKKEAILLAQRMDSVTNTGALILNNLDKNFKISSIRKPIYLNSDYRILSGLFSFYLFYKELVRNASLSTGIEFENIIDIIGNAMHRHFGEFRFDSENYEIDFGNGRSLEIEGYESYFEEGFTSDLRAQIGRSTIGSYLPVFDDLPSNPASKDIWKQITTLAEEFRNDIHFDEFPDDNPFMDDLYFIHFWANKRSEIKSVETQNEGLKKQITDNSVWFVSPRGDKFIAEFDEEIAQKGISSLTFHIDPSHPREHIATVEWEEKSIEPKKYWIDSEGNLMDKDRKPLKFESGYYQLFSNLLLRHLFVITSGILSKKAEKITIGDEINERTLAWRRAFYRFFKNDKFTMQSESARKHAEYILKDYGIDIYKEIERRRKVGTLLPGQVMTFVRETQPNEKGFDAKPLIASFDSSWIPKNLKIKHIVEK